MNDDQGLRLTSASEEAVRCYNEAVRQLLDYRVTAMPSAKQALVHDERFCMGHCLRGYMLMMYSTNRFHAAARNALAEARTASPEATLREQAHVQALAHWVAGDLHMACAHWEGLLVENPLDILALRLHHFVSFWMGRSQALVRTPAAVLPAWTKGTPGRGNVMGMLAFGLQEAGHTRLAERYGREAVELNPDDLWAVHSVAHVLETEHRFKDGLRWTQFDQSGWADRNPFRGHLWWHRGLFLLEAGRIEEAMALYDSAIYDTQSDFYLDIQNAAAFLARVEFLGVNVGDRWEVLAQHAQASIGDHVLPFTDLHCVLSLARTGRHGPAREYIESMRTESMHNDFHVAQVLRRVAIPIAEGLLASEKGQLDQALFALRAAKPMLHEVGASNAQRDLIALYTIEVARRTGNTRALAHQLQEHDFVMQLGWLHE